VAMTLFNKRRGLQGLVHRHLYFWTKEMVIQTTRLQFKRLILLKLSFVCHIIFSLNVSFFVGNNRLYRSTPINFILHLWENVSRLTSTWLKSPDSELPTIQLRVMSIL
jgi:hypothetical protein